MRSQDRGRECAPSERLMKMIIIMCTRQGLALHLPVVGGA